MHFLDSYIVLHGNGTIVHGNGLDPEKTYIKSICLFYVEKQEKNNI